VKNEKEKRAESRDKDERQSDETGRSIIPRAFSAWKKPPMQRLPRCSGTGVEFDIRNRYALHMCLFSPSTLLLLLIETFNRHKPSSTALKLTALIKQPKSLYPCWYFQTSLLCLLPLPHTHTHRSLPSTATQQLSRQHPHLGRCILLGNDRSSSGDRCDQQRWKAPSS
jgi:hypothetical protein